MDWRSLLPYLPEKENPYTTSNRLLLTVGVRLQASRNNVISFFVLAFPLIFHFFAWLIIRWLVPLSDWKLWMLGEFEAGEPFF